MKRTVLTLVLLATTTLGAPRAWAQYTQTTTLSVAGASCTSTGVTCLILAIPTYNGGATLTVSANASANTIQFEASGDGATSWVSLNATPSNSVTAVTSTTGTGTWQANVAGYTHIRLRMSAFVGGTTTVAATPSSASARAGGGGSVTVGSAGTIVGGTGGGTAQAQTLTPSPAITSYVTNGSVWYCWLPAAANTGAAPTLNISGLGAKPITKIGAGGVVALIANDLQTTAVACAVYDGTEFQLQNPQAGLVASASVSVGSNPPTACGTATSCEAFTEASTAGTPTAGQDYRRYDNTVHGPVCSNNGGAESAAACNGPSFALSGIVAATASNTIANGNNPQTWNWAQTTDAQDGMSFGETSASTGGTLTSGLPNQSVASFSTATNSTASPIEIAQGSITNTVATPALPVECTWNNASLVGICELTNVTNTASSVNSLILDKRVGNTSQFSVDRNGIVNFNGNGAAITSTPPTSGSSTAGFWKNCLGNVTSVFCTGLENFTEFHEGGAWFSISNQVNPNNNASATTPDTGAGASLGSKGGIDFLENACNTDFAPAASHSIICPDSTAHEYFGYLNGSATPGMFVRRQPTPISLTGQTAAIANGTQLCAASAGACNIAGQYRVTAYFDTTTSGTGNIGFNVTYTDEAGTKTAQTVPMDVAGATSLAATMALTAANNATATTSFWSTGASQIGYGITYASTGTYSARIVVERLQ